MYRGHYYKYIYNSLVKCLLERWLNDHIKNDFRSAECLCFVKTTMEDMLGMLWNIIKTYYSFVSIKRTISQDGYVEPTVESDAMFVDGK